MTKKRKHEILQKAESGALHRNVNLLDLDKMVQNEFLLTKIGLDTAENERFFS